MNVSRRIEISLILYIRLVYTTRNSVSRSICIDKKIITARIHLVSANARVRIIQEYYAICIIQHNILLFGRHIEIVTVSTNEPCALAQRITLGYSPFCSPVTLWFLAHYPTICRIWSAYVFLLCSPRSLSPRGTTTRHR